MLMKDLLTEEFLEKVTEPLYEVARKMSNEVVGIIADRLKGCGELTPSDITKLKNTMRIADFKKIEKAISELSGMGVDEINTIFDKVATENEQMAKVLYDYRGVEQVPYLKNKEMNAIVQSAVKNATKDFLALSQTTVMALKLGNKEIPLKKAYNKIIDEAVFSLNQGAIDYTSAIRHTIKELSKNGTRVVYESGYTRRLDSSVRMNILDGCRQMNLSIREQQAKEYGADGWEISAHALCRPDHQAPQGRVFSLKEFEELNNSLPTPIATGEMNCKHTKVGVIMEINQPAYTDKELKELSDSANEEVTFTGISGKKITKTRYECTQYMRALETMSREQKDIANVLGRVKDEQGKKQALKERTKIIEEYKRVSKEVGIPEKLNRL